MSSLWDASRYMTLGFMGTYKTKELMFSLTAVQLINVLSNMLRAVVSAPIGKFSDKHSCVKGMKLGFLIVAIGYGFNIFASPDSRWCVIIYTVLFNMSLAGTNQNNFNIAYKYVDSKYLSQAMAIKNCISGVIGFLSSIVGGYILAFVQNRENMLFGFHIYGQQVLSAISLIFVLLTIAFASSKFKE